MDERIEAWPDALEEAIVGSRRFDRVRVLRETGSTQDAARAAAGGRPGLIVTAGRQTAGRGQLGRAWEQRGDLGVAVTFVVAGGESRVLSMVGGVSALEACRACGVRAAWLKSPNDVIVADPSSPSGFRKLAGVLVEQGDGLALAGVGVNVLQQRDDFGPELAATATSLRLLGAGCSRIDVLLALVRAMDAWLGRSVTDVEAEWDRAVLIRSGATPGAARLSVSPVPPDHGGSTR